MPTVSRAGREYLSWTITTKPAITTAPDVAFLARGEEVAATTTWVPGEWADAGTTNASGEMVRTMRVLVAGPDAPAATPAGHQLSVGDYRPRVRVTDSPESIIRESTELVSVR